MFSIDILDVLHFWSVDLSLQLPNLKRNWSQVCGFDIACPLADVKKDTTPLSSCLEGTKIEGANILKGQAPVLAMADDQYPEWLWTILQPKVYEDEGPGSKAERQKRRAANKQRIKDRNFMSTQ